MNNNRNNSVLTVCCLIPSAGLKMQPLHTTDLCWCPERLADRSWAERLISHSHRCVRDIKCTYSKSAAHLEYFMSKQCLEVQQSVNRIKRFSHLEALLLLTDAAGSNTHTFLLFHVEAPPPRCVLGHQVCGCFRLLKNIGLMELMAHTVEAVFWPQISSSALSTLFVVTHQRSMDGSKMSVCSFLSLNPVFADERHWWHTPFLSASHHTTHTDECLHAHTPAAELLPQTYLNCDLTTHSIHSFFYPGNYGSTPQAGLRLLPWWQRGPGVNQLYWTQKGNSVGVTQQSNKMFNYCSSTQILRP